MAFVFFHGGLISPCLIFILLVVRATTNFRTVFAEHRPSLDDKATDQSHHWVEEGGNFLGKGENNGREEGKREGGKGTGEEGKGEERRREVREGEERRMEAGEVREEEGTEGKQVEGGKDEVREGDSRECGGKIFKGGEEREREREREVESFEREKKEGKEEDEERGCEDWERTKKKITNEDRRKEEGERQYDLNRPRPIRYGRLGITINRVDLETFYLDKKSARNDTSFVTSGCNGGICPNFQKCFGNFSEEIEACWSTNLLKKKMKKIAAAGGEVYILNSVYVNIFGFPFTPKYHFHRGGCAGDVRKKEDIYSYHLDTKIVVFKEFVNFAHVNGLNFYHFMTEWIPAFVEFVDILREKPEIPVICRAGQREKLLSLGSYIFGDHINQLNIYEVYSHQLFLGERVYQPCFATCHFPNSFQWNNLRKAFVSQDGFPIFNSDWSFREPKFFLDRSNHEVGSDWVAILGKRYGPRQLVQSDQVEKGMVDYFGRERVKVFDGNLSLSDAKKLFNRALVFVAPHGAILTNMLFMPTNGFIFEIKPRLYTSGTFLRLSKTCGHNYYSLVGSGTKWTTIKSNMKSFWKRFKEMVRIVKLTQPQFFWEFN